MSFIFPRKRKFHGNQNTSTETASSNEEIMTASSLKLQQCNEVNNDVSNISEHLTGNRLIDLEILIGIFSLLCCPTKMCTAGSLYLVEDSRERKCNSKTEQQNVKLQCNHHKGSSSSMEPVGAYRIFERSEDHRMLRYADYYGDGDSKAFDAVKDIYGKDILLRS
ncbi:uncharacterized protein TNCV_456041 [Trichonephila clavipes]|nr:uncharacterized protein TNCV_456041 [Trichonephila clavipes]